MNPIFKTILLIVVGLFFTHCSYQGLEKNDIDDIFLDIMEEDFTEKTVTKIFTNSKLDSARNIVAGENQLVLYWEGSYCNKNALDDSGTGKLYIIIPDTNKIFLDSTYNTNSSFLSVELFNRFRSSHFTHQIVDNIFLKFIALSEDTSIAVVEVRLNNYEETVSDTMCFGKDYAVEVKCGKKN